MLITRFISCLMKKPQLVPQPPQRNKDQKHDFSETTTATIWMSLLFQELCFARQTLLFQLLQQNGSSVQCLDFFCGSFPKESYVGTSDWHGWGHISEQCLWRDLGSAIYFGEETLNVIMLSNTDILFKMIGSLKMINLHQEMP